MDRPFDMFGTSSDFEDWSDDGTGSNTNSGSSSTTWTTGSSSSDSGSGTESPLSDFENPWGDHGMGAGMGGDAEMFPFPSAPPGMPFVPATSGDDITTASDGGASYSSDSEALLERTAPGVQMPAAEMPDAEMPMDMSAQQMYRSMAPQLSDMRAHRPPLASTAVGAGGYMPPAQVETEQQLETEQVQPAAPALGTTAEIVTRGRLQKLERWEDFEQLLVSHRFPTSSPQFRVVFCPHGR